MSNAVVVFYLERLEVTPMSPSEIPGRVTRVWEKSGWSRAEVARRIGREGNQNQISRWLGKSSTGKPRREKTGKPRKDGTPRRDIGSRPQPDDLLALSDLFVVDIRWLIDDSLEWEDR